MSDSGRCGGVELTCRFDRLEAPEKQELGHFAEIEGICCGSCRRCRSPLLAVERVTRFMRNRSSRPGSPPRNRTSCWAEGYALSRVGIYVPGEGQLPSSVIMNAVPARVAGVGEIIMVALLGGEISPHVRGSQLSGVDRIFRVGGAQAVAALAYGTATIPRVDKITGPGNIYTAKKLVFGQVGIDMIAGPSEILVINDGSGNPAHIAADLLSGGDDELASSILITTDRSLQAKGGGVELQLATLP
jgi:histidinol dehydrogenase